MEKKLKVMAARAESACTRTSSELVAAHWLVRKQKPTNHRKVQRAGETMGEEWIPGHVSWAAGNPVYPQGTEGTQGRSLPWLCAVLPTEAEGSEGLGVSARRDG